MGDFKFYIWVPESSVTHSLDYLSKEKSKLLPAVVDGNLNRLFYGIHIAWPGKCSKWVRSRSVQYDICPTRKKKTYLEP